MDSERATPKSKASAAAAPSSTADAEPVRQPATPASHPAAVAIAAQQRHRGYPEAAGACRGGLGTKPDSDDDLQPYDLSEGEEEGTSAAK